MNEEKCFRNWYKNGVRMPESLINKGIHRHPNSFKSCHPHHLYGILHKTRQYSVYFFVVLDKKCIRNYLFALVWGTIWGTKSLSIP